MKKDYCDLIEFYSGYIMKHESGAVLFCMPYA